VPVIVITARSHQYELAVRNKIDALMEKPLDLPVLLDTIQNLLDESREARVTRVSNPGFKTRLLSTTGRTP